MADPEQFLRDRGGQAALLIFPNRLTHRGQDYLLVACNSPLARIIHEGRVKIVPGRVRPGAEVDSTGGGVLYPVEDRIGRGNAAWRVLGRFWPSFMNNAG